MQPAYSIIQINANDKCIMSIYTICNSVLVLSMFALLHSLNAYDTKIGFVKYNFLFGIIIIVSINDIDMLIAFR